MTLLFLTFLISAFITPLIIFLYKKFNWLDDPKENKNYGKNTHKNPIPRGGGLVIFISISIVSLLFLPLDSYLKAILLASLILTITGFFDDLFDLNPYFRFFINFVVAFIIVQAGIRINYISNPFSHGVILLNFPHFAFSLGILNFEFFLLADLITMLFIVFFINVINWSKGVDGQLPSFVFISLIFIGLLAQRFVDDPTSFQSYQLSFIASGAFLGFLIWNFYPQKIMPGYGGGSLAGFFLSVLAILGGAKLATSFIILSLPIADAILTIFNRIKQKKSPFWGDRGHLHHYLLDKYHWSKKQISLFYFFVGLGMGFLSLTSDTLLKFAILLIVIITNFTLLIKIKQK
jgi:UDP-GlcNAc:undecaprenyl-phosphate GlcNAc-1-phosphate transferase